MSGYSNNTIFWVETSKIHPNPYQPRREFEPSALEDLADSIRQYGVLQPLVVTRDESYRDDGSMDVSYELIAGERRLRAAKIAELPQVPVIIRKETDSKARLELAIIENLQREDLNPIDRALAFEQLYTEFKLTHAEIGKKMGKSRVYVSNSLRLLSLPDEIKRALMDKKISEGHTRPLLMLNDRPEEQATLLKEILIKNMSVRDAEKIARKVAQDKVRKKEYEVDPKIRDYEKRISENLGTRVHIEPKEKGGKIVIDYFTINDLETIISSFKASGQGDSKNPHRMMEQFLKDAVQTEQNHQQDHLDTSTPLKFKDNKEEDTGENNNESSDEEVMVDSSYNDDDTSITPQGQAGDTTNIYSESVRDKFSANEEGMNDSLDNTSIASQGQVNETANIYSEPARTEPKEHSYTNQDVQNQELQETKEDTNSTAENQTQSFQQHYVEEPLSSQETYDQNLTSQTKEEGTEEHPQQVSQDRDANQPYHVSEFLSGNPYHNDTPRNQQVTENQNTQQHQQQEERQQYPHQQQVNTQQERPIPNTNIDGNTPNYGTQLPHQQQYQMNSRQQTINHNAGHIHQPIPQGGNQQQQHRPPQEIVDAYRQSTQFYKQQQPDNQQDTQQNSYQQGNLYNR
jgi:ParB family chromosome partitioning protein